MLARRSGQSLGGLWTLGLLRRGVLHACYSWLCCDADGVSVRDGVRLHDWVREEQTLAHLSPPCGLPLHLIRHGVPIVERRLPLSQRPFPSYEDGSWPDA